MQVDPNNTLLRDYRVLLVASAALSAPTNAHHSFAVYDSDTVLTVTGTVTRYEWTNPHVYLFVAVEDENGEIVEWALEGESTALLTRAGWSRTMLAPGDRISARINRNRNPAQREARILTLVTPDGTILGRRATNAAVPRVGAHDLTGVWDALRDYGDFEFVRGTLTARGAAAVNAFDERRSPVQDCLAFATPIATVLPYRSEIELGGDRITIRSEYFSVERVIYMDGRPHPENGERTEQGHSIGSWDGDTLIVDTALFADHPIGNWRGLPSGPRKHVVERFEPTPDRTQLRITFRVEDPDYLVDPWAGEIVWDYVPDGEMLPFVCDPEAARRFATP
jgi:hypothetical protein